MNHSIKRIVAGILLLCSTVVPLTGAFADGNPSPSSGNVNKGVFLDEIGAGTGYAWGSLKNHSEDMTVYPVFMRIGFNINSLFGIKSSAGKVQFILEPFYNTIESPVSGYEAGCSIGLRYLRELSASAGFYLEGSVAPMYLSIDTVEQGASGFNFLDQIGTGLQFKLSGNNAVYAGYRFRHISHAGLVDRPNTGINSNALVIGFSWLY